MSVVPEQINYTKILPLAVESRARRRSFLPTNGQLFNSAQNNIIQIGISANAFLDTKESYLRMRLTNTTGQTLGEITEAFNRFLNAIGFQVEHYDEVYDLTLED